MEPDITRLLRFAQSPEGQQLIRLLQKNDPAALRSAAAQATAGDMKSAGKTLSPLLDDPQIKALLEKLGGGL
jgi:hypothetical protein